MKIDRTGTPFIAAGWLPAVCLLGLGRLKWAVPFAAAGAFFAFFFRDPDRHAPADADAVLSPADGRVLVAGPAFPNDAPPGRWQQISIFLSPLDVHVNRVPVSGRITRVEYRPGKFLPAYRAEAATENEQTEIWIDHDGRTLVFRQVVGILARRIVCRLQAGHTVRAGDRFGIMKFGSRMDVFVPPDAELLVRPDDRVWAGETRLARLGAGREERHGTRA